MGNVITYMKSHPWATGIIVVVGGLIFFMLTGLGGGSSETSSDGSYTPKMSDAEIAANAQITAAQIQAQAQASAAGAAIQQSQIGAGVQMNSDKLAAEIAMRGLEVQQSLGLGQQSVDVQTGLASIGAQRDVQIATINGQVSQSQIQANALLSATKSNNKQKTISGIVGAIGGIASIFSDQRLKENITYIGKNKRGVGIYEYNYKGSDKRRRGVIAQDVARSHPELVHEDRSGYLKVDTLSLAMGA